MEKARLISDMMTKMRGKIKDSNLRSIDLRFENTKVKKPHSVFGDDMEELKFSRE